MAGSGHDPPSPQPSNRASLPNPPPISPPFPAHLLRLPFLPRFPEHPNTLSLPQPHLAVFSHTVSYFQERIHGELHAESGKNIALVKKQVGHLAIDQENGESCRYYLGASNSKSAEAFPGSKHADAHNMSESPKASLNESSSQTTTMSAEQELNEDGSSAGTSSDEDLRDDLAVQDNQRGQVSPLRALSHIAHMKRKQDCYQDHCGQTQASPTAEALVQLEAPPKKKMKKKLKQVQFHLEPLIYQKLMRLLSEHHQGSFQKFVLAALNNIVMQDKSAKSMRKPAMSKWKRTRFDQLKGIETQELALAFRSLASSTPDVKVTEELMSTPWQELNMAQLQQMLEDTKKMLLMNEKVHTCPHADCDRKFVTPGNLRDHLNEHSGELPYSCSFEDCSHRFRSKQHLCRHMKKHERAYTCNFQGCNRRFAFKERLIVHQKIHSDERPLACPWEGCGKTFKWANSLHGHIRTHTGEKPFQCPFAGCGRLFGYKVDLTRHHRTHFGQPARANH